MQPRLRNAVVALLLACITAAPQTTTEWLRSEAGGELFYKWVRRDARPVAAGTLPNATLARYLVQDHKFVDAFMVLLASMVAHAPTLVDRVPGPTRRPRCCLRHG